MPLMREVNHPIRLMILDNQPNMRNGLRIMFGSAADIDVVAAETFNGNVIGRILAVQPDMVVIDLISSWLIAGQVLHSLEQGLPAMPVIALVHHEQSVDHEMLHPMVQVIKISSQSTREELIYVIRTAKNSKVEQRL